MKKILLIALTLCLVCCQKESSKYNIEGGWEGSVAEHYETNHKKYLTLWLFEGEATLDKTPAVIDKSWQKREGTYSVEGNTITINFTPKYKGKKHITHAEIVESEKGKKIVLKVHWTQEGDEGEDTGWIWFHKKG